MCELYFRCKQNRHIQKILFPIIILVHIGLIIYFIISNDQQYKKYENRDTYIIYHVQNTTSNYYIIRANLNDTINCSSNALFTFDVTAVYTNIISKHDKQNILFVIVYWLTSIVAIVLSICDTIFTIIEHCKQFQREYENVDENHFTAIGFIRSIGSQLLQKGSFIFPTYFIGIFDYTQLCLPHHTKASSFILDHTYIGIFVSLFSTIYLILWTLACWESRRHENYHDALWFKDAENLTCRHKTASSILLFILCLTIIPVGIYGIFVWITSLLEFLLTTKAVLIFVHFILGVLHQIIKSCRRL